MTQASPDFAAATVEDIAQRRSDLVARWETGWTQMLEQWAQTGGDAIWLMYSANYLMRTANVRWAVDPVRLRNLVGEASAVNVDALTNLSFVLMTHRHSDHIDSALLTELAGMSIQWVVPAHMADVVLQAGVPTSRIIVPEPMQPIDLQGVRVTPFDGLHWRYPGQWGVGKPSTGVDATGYFVQWNDRNLLLPGDTRTYDPAALPTFASVQTLFAHVWLGRGAAEQTPPPLLEPFCDFVAALKPQQRVILAHLWQVARGPSDYWDHRHAEVIRRQLERRLPDVSVNTPDFWKMLSL